MSDPLSYTDAEFAAGNVGNIGKCRGLVWFEQVDYEEYMTVIDEETEDGE